MISISFIAGFISSGVIGIISFKFGQGISIWENRMIRNTDKRVKMINEIFNNIKVIKMNGWEYIFQKRIFKLRDKENKYLKKHIFSWIKTIALIYITPNTQLMSVFMLYIYLGNSLSIKLAFGVMTGFFII